MGNAVYVAQPAWLEKVSEPWEGTIFPPRFAAVSHCLCGRKKLCSLLSKGVLDIQQIALHNFAVICARSLSLLLFRVFMKRWLPQY